MASKVGALWCCGAAARGEASCVASTAPPPPAPDASQRLRPHYRPTCLLNARDAYCRASSVGGGYLTLCHLDLLRLIACYNLGNDEYADSCLCSKVHARVQVRDPKHPIPFELHQFISNFNLRYDGFTAHKSSCSACFLHSLWIFKVLAFPSLVLLVIPRSLIRDCHKLS